MFCLFPEWGGGYIQGAKLFSERCEFFLGLCSTVIPFVVDAYCPTSLSHYMSPSLMRTELNAFSLPFSSILCWHVHKLHTEHCTSYIMNCMHTYCTYQHL